MEIEHDNLRAALEWSQTTIGNAEAALRLSGALHWFWNMHGHWGEGRGWLEEAIACSGSSPVRFVAKAVQAATHFAMRQGDYERAVALGEKGLSLCQEPQDREQKIQLLAWLGSVRVRKGEYAEAARLYQQSLDVSCDLGQKWLTGFSLSLLGNVAQYQGDYERAASLHMQSVDLSREAGHKDFTAVNLRRLGTDMLRQGDHRVAAGYFRDSLRLSREVGNKWLTGECLDGLAEVASTQQHYGVAARLLAAAERLGKLLGVRLSIADQTHHDRCVGLTRAALGAEFAAAWAEGRAMTPEQAIEYALAAEPG